MLFCGKCWKIVLGVGLTDNEFTFLCNRSQLLISPQFSDGPTRKIPNCIWKVSRKISFLSKKMNNFNYSSDDHFGPLNAFPICHSGWHRGLCYQRTLLSSPLWKRAFPPHSKVIFLWPWEDPAAVETIAQLVFMAFGEMQCCWPRKKWPGLGGDSGGLGRIWISCWRLWFPPRLLQASCPTWAARAPPARTTWPTVWKSSRRTHSGIKSSWRNSTAPWLLPQNGNLSARKRRSCGPCTSITGSTIPWVWVLASGPWPPLHAGPHCKAWLACWAASESTVPDPQASMQSGEAQLLRRRKKHFQGERETAGEEGVGTRLPGWSSRRFQEQLWSQGACALSHFSRVWLWPCGLEPTRLLCPWDSPGKKYWRASPHPPPGDLPDPEIESTSLMSPVLAGGFSTTSATWEAPVASVVMTF